MINSKYTFVAIVLFFSLTITSCDLNKLKKENKALTEKVLAQDQTITDLSARLKTAESSLQNAELENDQLKVATEKLAQIETELVAMKESDQGYYEKALVAYNKALETLALNDLADSKISWETFMQKYPNSQFIKQAEEYLKQVKKQERIAGPITEGETKIEENLKKHEFNNAYYELNKIKNYLDNERFNKNRKKIETALNTPIIFSNYEEFYDNSLAGLWLESKYKVYAKLDNKGTRFCNPELKDCSFEHSIKVRSGIKSKNRAVALKKMFGQSGCFEIFMKNKWIYIKDFTDKTCPTSSSIEDNDEQ